MNVKGKNVFAGLSGGVDSAVSAALLREAGAQVTGVFFKGWYPPGMPCTWTEDRRDAMRTAARLQIPFRTLDASAEYKSGVIDYLLSEYRAGRMPNPDVMCNREVKFGAFYRYAKAAGADAIAMGHYRSGEKDQSYFLWAVPKDILEKTIFPVGDFEKDTVRALAHTFKLPVAEKRDSQGVCFLGSISIEEFLRAEFGEAPGEAIDQSGRMVGTHNGVLLHTLGERVVLVGATEPGPWFVHAKNISLNQLMVGKERISGGIRTKKEILIVHENWFARPKGAIEAQYRYRGPHIRGEIRNNVFVSSDELPEIPAPGQSMVFYHSGNLIGGGIIAA